MKTLDTLVPDIYKVIENGGGWDSTITKFLAEGITQVAEERFSEKQIPRDYLSLSALGTPCQRKLWYRVNTPQDAQPLGAEALGTFFYGDLLEVLVIALAKAAGHDVQGAQDKLEVHGIKGHRDCIIDGVTVDVKSCNSRSIDKFKKNKLREDDPFGYISQLSSYVYAGRNDPLVRNKHEGAFLAVQKDRFKLCLDRYDFTEELKTKEQEIATIKSKVAASNPDAASPRVPPVPQYPKKPDGNMRLDTICSYCEFRQVCYPEARVFQYANGRQYLTEVKKEPEVTEIIE